MKKFLISVTAIAVVGALAYSIPPVRRQIIGAKDRFTAAFKERESDLRAALLADDEKISQARSRRAAHRADVEPDSDSDLVFEF